MTLAEAHARYEATSFEDRLLLPDRVQAMCHDLYLRLRRESEGRGGNQPNLNAILLREHEVQLAPLDQQRRVVGVLSRQLAEVDLAQRTLEQQFVAISTLPAALLRRAFSGEP